MDEEGYSRKGRPVDEEGTSGREVWWMRKEQQGGKVGGLGRNSRSGRLLDQEETAGRDG